MLYLLDSRDNSFHKIYIVDMHAHIGHDVDGAHKVIGPRVVGGTYNFMSWVTYGTSQVAGIVERLVDDVDKSPDEQKYRYHLATEKGSLIKLGAGQTFRDIAIPYEIPRVLISIDPEVKKLISNAWLIDKTVVFPMHDIFSVRPERGGTYKGEIEYIPSIKNIARWVNMYPDGLKLIGYARFNPHDIREIKDITDIRLSKLIHPEENTVYKEFEKAIKFYNLQGLKLHPISEEFNPTIPQVVALLIQAAILDVPVTFDCKSIGIEKKIYDATNQAIVYLFNHNADFLVPRLRVVIAHYGWHIAYEESFKILSHPSIYADISASTGNTIYSMLENDYLQSQVSLTNAKTVHTEIIEQFSKKDEAPIKFTKDALKRFSNFNRLNKLYNGEITNIRWSKKINFGSDYSFIDVWQSIEILDALLSNRLSIDPDDLKRVLGLTALSIIKPKFRDINVTRPMREAKVPLSGTVSVNHSEPTEKSLIEFLMKHNYKPYFYDRLLRYNIKEVPTTDLSNLSIMLDDLKDNAFVLTVKSGESGTFIPILVVKNNLMNAPDKVESVSKNQFYYTLLPIDTMEQALPLGRRILHINEATIKTLIPDFYTALITGATQ